MVIHSKCAGTLAMEGVQEILARIQKSGAAFPLLVTLLPEPSNSYDPDAIQVIVTNKKGVPYVVGYIPNRQTICGSCNAVFDRHPGTTSCPTCNRLGHLQRYGLATRLAKESITGCWITEITGGSDGKCYGANLRIELKDEPKET